MRILLVVFFSLWLTGCAVTPYKDLNLDTTSDFKSPTKGMSGVYVYQWKSGILGAGSDVNFQIKGQPTIPLNTGEYGYLEVAPGKYEYKLIGGFQNLYIPVDFEADQNYFFRAVLVNFSDRSVLIRDQKEIDETKKNIATGRYEVYDVD